MKSRFTHRLGEAVLLTGMLSCGSRDDQRSVELEATGTATAAVISAGSNVETDGTTNFAEASATQFISNGTEEIIALSNAGAPADPNNFHWGCSRDGGNTWRTQAAPVSGSNNGSDPSGVSGGGFFFAANLMEDGRTTGGIGFRILRSSDMCPATGGAALTYVSWVFDQTNASVDYPHLMWSQAEQSVFITWRQKDAGGVPRINIARFNPNGDITRLTFWTDQCSNVPSEPGTVNGFVDPSTDVVHFVYSAAGDRTIRHDTFNPANGNFACGNQIIGSYSPPSGTCASQCPGVNTYNYVGSGCLRETHTPFIANNARTGTYMVAYSTPGSGSCSDASETRWYRSANSGASWSFIAVTGCQNSLQPTILSVTNTNTWHTMSSYAGHGGTLLAQVDWTSGNDGVNWGGGTFTGNRPQFTGIAPSCYWGDFNGTALTNEGVFYDWGQSNPVSCGPGCQHAPVWSIEGAFLTP